MSDLNVVGKPHLHDSAKGHVSGTAIYIDDRPDLAGTLHIAPGYADETCGSIKSIDLSAVKAAEGVVCVLTAADIPGVNDCSPAMGDDEIFASSEITFHGQVVFAVVAKTRILARRAAKLAKIEIETNEPLITASDGRKANASVLPTYKFEGGDADLAISNAALKITDQLKIGGQEHFYLEGQIALAIPKDTGEYIIYSSTQHPAEIQHTIAKMLNLQDAAVVCETRRMGGAFGGKESQAAQWAAIAALAVFVTGKPAKVRLDRDDDMMMTGKRHDFDCQWSVGFDQNGVIEGMKVNYDARCGVSADLSMGINDRAMFHTDNAYFYQNFDITSHRVRTNTVSNTAFRGFGGPQGVLFAERMIEGIAIKTGRDPLDVRCANFYREGKQTTPYGMQIEDNIIADIVTELEATSDYRARRREIEKFNQNNRYLKKGLALTPVKFGIAFTLKHLNQAGALVHVYADGSVQINHGGTEMGQGLNTKVAQVVAEGFGIDLSQVYITATSTDKVPNTTPTAASSGSDLNGKAAQVAVEKIKQRLIDLAAKLYDVETTQIEFANNQVICGEHKLSFAALANKAFLARISLSDTGFYSTPKITWDRDKKTGRPFLYFSYGASCSEVIIDTLTGEMKVTRVDILHDVGNSINPAIDIGQIEGGFVQGMGWLTTEELMFDGKGRLTTHAPSTYKIPTAYDVPEDFRVNLNPSNGNLENTIYKSKAIGEPPVMLATSVYCAVFDAIASLKKGAVPNLPAPTTPEAILNAIKAI
ncbi:MAG: xanthine dehydrogenase molybdopterin binding subunit [Rhizobiales bacterium]|nr:xanthine dehydrogenase molybdopterin binding subunit [Hyphomicrobiales bacterium]NRB14539.1 xanthine dehydrogenase molybdopterin binding subunit [Hyphomicrobiales bacterium]